MRVGTDCSGIEAPLYALRGIGKKIDHVFSSEIDPHARQSLLANHKPRHMYEDLTQRNHAQTPRVDLYVCGFPCQPFSVYGHQKGMNDIRANVFLHCYEYIRLKHPKIFVLENVKGLRGNNGGKTYKRIRKMLEDLTRYDLDEYLLDTQDYGIPQHRERLFFIGRRKDIVVSPLERPKPVELKYGIVEYLEKQNLNISRETHPKLYRRMPCEMRKDRYDILRKRYKVKSLTKHPIVVDLQTTGSFISCGYNISPTLRARRSSFYVTCLRRKTSVREALALQGFPKSFKIVTRNSQVFKQCGNAMSVNVLKHLFRSIFRSVNM